VSAPGSSTQAHPELYTSESSRTAQRFAFGENWRRFLSILDETRIRAAEASLLDLLGRERLDGLRVLDIGSGSGLFSLAFRRLGATVHSFDYDAESVACTGELRRRFHADDPAWVVERGSVLDSEYLKLLGTFDVVYSWGVLHHTGAMWQAIENAAGLVAPGGTLAIALYNRQRLLTPLWSAVKRTYVRLPKPCRPLLVWPYLLYAGLASAGADVLRGRAPWSRWRVHGHRGMSLYHDARDWVGGWPFEAATPAAVRAFIEARGLLLRRLKPVGWRHGCNEFAFVRSVAC